MSSWGIGSRGLFSWGRGKREGQKQATTKVVARFRDAPVGPPTSWVPPCVPPSISPQSSQMETAHIPLERGGAGVGR